MKLAHLIVSLFFYLNYLSADEPVAIVSKIRGKVKYKFESENKFHINVKQNALIYLNSQIQTRKKAFSKIVYLDDGSVISIYPESEIIIRGSINEREIKKQIQVIRGMIWVNSSSNVGTDLTLSTITAELNCNNCSFWVSSDESIGDKFILESGQAKLYNSSVRNTITLLADSTVISKDELELEMVPTSVTDIKFLESLMLSADEKSVNIKKKETEEQKEDIISNIVIIKLKNAANVEREIVINYKQKNDIPIE
jgi:hypothetical protein